MDGGAVIAYRCAVEKSMSVWVCDLELVSRDFIMTKRLELCCYRMVFSDVKKFQNSFFIMSIIHLTVCDRNMYLICMIVRLYDCVYLYNNVILEYTYNIILRTKTN